MFKLVLIFAGVLLLSVSCGQLKTNPPDGTDNIAVNDHASTDSDSIVSGDEDDPLNDIAGGDTDNPATDDPGNDTATTDNQTTDEDVVSPTCGNGTVEGVELCDGTIDNCVDVDPYEYSGGKAQCLDNCTGWDTDTCEKEDQCVSGDKKCTDSTHYATCGDPDSDSYTEWGPETLCPDSGTCSGNGECSVPCTTHYTYDCYSGDVYYYDSCGGLEDLKEECGVSGYTGSNYCSSGNVYRDYVTRGCSSYDCTESTAAALIESCTNGCSGGVCNAEKAAIWYDSTSGLTWQNTAISTYSQSSGSTYCANLSLGSYSDWRLPTVSELRSLARSCTKITTGGTCSVIDSCTSYASCYNSSNCGTCTSGAGPSDAGMYWDAALIDTGSTYWSATVLSDYASSYGWTIDFTSGTLAYQYLTDPFSVRCARGTASGYCGDGTVNGSEICDGDSTSCESVLGSSYTGTAYCSGDCYYWDTYYCSEAGIEPPATVSASDGSYTGYIYISWSAVTGADSYYVYRSTSSGGTYSVVSSAQTSTYYYDYPPLASTYYYYKVVAYDSSLGYSDYSTYNEGWCY